MDCHVFFGRMEWFPVALSTLLNSDWLLSEAKLSGLPCYLIQCWELGKRNRFVPFSLLHPFWLCVCHISQPWFGSSCLSKTEGVCSLYALFSQCPGCIGIHCHGEDQRTVEPGLDIVWNVFSVAVFQCLPCGIFCFISQDGTRVERWSFQHIQRFHHL